MADGNFSRPSQPKDRPVSASLAPFGPFELLAKVGSGGMGSVYKARLIGTKELIAVKIANPVVAADATLSQRFENEFKLASKLLHPNLVRPLDHGVEKGTPYLVMEFVPGRSLHKQIQEAGPMAIGDAIMVFEQVGAALAYIHENHIVHRDIKPGNILIDPDGRGKLADLGLIKDLDSQVMLTQSRMGLGTMEFCAPEQFEDAKHVDLRCDIYALAASFYVAVTGKYPFGPGSQMRILMHKLDHQFTPLSAILKDVSPALEQLLNRSLHPDPNVRPSSVAEFLKEMRSIESPAEKLVPKAMPTSPATVEKRGKGKRHAVRMATTLGVLSASLKDSWAANIMDISTGGLCLQIARRFEPKTLLNVHLPDEKTGTHVPHLVRACWVKQLPDQSWLHGCIFVSAMEDEDLDRFLFNGLTQTSKLHNTTTDQTQA